MSKTTILEHYQNLTINPSLRTVWGDSFNGNWALNAAIGYQFTNYLGAELGGIYNFESKANETQIDSSTIFVDASNIRVKIQPWYAYLAGKLTLPICQRLNGFTKLGLAYMNFRADDLSNTDPTQSLNSYTQNRVAPMFGLGLSYDITKNIYISGQWLFFMSKVNHFTIGTSYPNTFLLDLGYKFGI